jgi:hypothetical protein
LFVLAGRLQWLLGESAEALALKGRRTGGRELVHHRIFLDEAYWFFF